MNGFEILLKTGDLQNAGCQTQILYLSYLLQTRASSSEVPDYPAQGISALISVTPFSDGDF